ncbi:c-type cytochrome [Deinococcus lacus]|uniref:C-type cytochrome n=1 Tax=Deinococcus lacus TaxID=392561 RepID=A0ABW1Y9K0_9DEIO
MVRPWRQVAGDDPYAAQRTRLEQQRQDLYQQLSDLQDERLRPGLERRAALTLRELDQLPLAQQAPTPPAWGLAGMGLAALLTLAGAFTFIPQWQLLGVGEPEASRVVQAVRLPSLQAQAKQQGTAPAYLAWGDAAFENGLYTQAMTAYAETLKLDPRQPRPLRRLGSLLLNQPRADGTKLTPADAQQAFLLIQTAAQLAPDDSESQLLLGYALYRFGEDGAALEALERYRTLNPEGRDADELITDIRARATGEDPAAALYAASCASCHGPAGGGGLGPSLRLSNLSPEAARRVIVQGKGTMPAYPDLSETQLSGLIDLLQSWQGAALSRPLPKVARRTLLEYWWLLPVAGTLGTFGAMGLYAARIHRGQARSKEVLFRPQPPVRITLISELAQVWSQAEFSCGGQPCLLVRTPAPVAGGLSQGELHLAAHSRLCTHLQCPVVMVRDPEVLAFAYNYRPPIARRAWAAPATTRSLTRRQAKRCSAKPRRPALCHGCNWSFGEKKSGRWG